MKYSVQVADQLSILLPELLAAYTEQLPFDLAKYYDHLTDSPLSADTFSFYVSVSAVFSSKIEGENIDLDSYLKHRLHQVRYQPDYTRKIDDLYTAYQYAQTHRLTKSTLFQAHNLLTAHLLPANQRKRFRTAPMFVLTNDGRIEYVAADGGQVAEDMNKLLTDLQLLLKTDLTYAQTFFFAALLHLVFVKIHPMADGNGRTARLLEKWFLAEKLDNKAWFIQSERMYYGQHALYYQNLRRLGLEYNELDYLQALPFLLMLPQSLVIQ